MDGLRKKDSGLIRRSSFSNSLRYSRRTIRELFSLSISLGFAQTA